MVMDYAKKGTNTKGAQSKKRGNEATVGGDGENGGYAPSVQTLFNLKHQRAESADNLKGFSTRYIKMEDSFLFFPLDISAAALL